MILGSNVRKEEYDRVPWEFMFLGHHSFHYAFEASSGSKGKYGLPVMPGFLFTEPENELRKHSRLGEQGGGF